MWFNPNWSKPPLRFVIIVFIPLFSAIGICQGQGQGQRIPPPQVGIPQRQGAAGFPGPQPRPLPLRPQNPAAQPAFQQGQVPFLPQQPFQMIQSPRLPPGFSNGSSLTEPLTPLAPIQLSSIVNLGPELNMKLSLFQSVTVMAHAMPNLKSNPPDYILSLKPELFKGIPAVNISMALQDSANPQVLKSLVTHSSGMLDSQKSVIVWKLASRLEDPTVIHMILGAENPAELIAFFNPRLLRKSMAGFIQAIGEFTSSRSEPNILKVRLLPTNFLSIMLTTLLGDNPLSSQTLSSRSFGHGDLISSSLMGINCHQLQNVKHDQVVPILKIFRTQLVGMRKVTKNLNYPFHLRNCSLEAIKGHLEMKMTEGDNATNLLSLIEGNEIEAIGGEVFTGLGKESLETIPVELRRQILIEIGQVETFDLLFLVPMSQLQWYGKTLLVDLNSSPVSQSPGIAPSTSGLLDPQSLLHLGNLFCYADILKANASKESIRQLLTTKMTQGAKTCCLDPMGQLEWSSALKKAFGSDTSLWKSEELGLSGDLLVSLSREDIAKIPDSEIGKIISGLLPKSGLNFNVHGVHGSIPFARACSELLEDPSAWLASFKALMRKYVIGAQLMVNSMQGAQKVLENDRTNTRRVVRETLKWDDYVDQDYMHFGRSFDEETLRYSRNIHESQQRYRRQAPMGVAPPPLVRVPPPQFQPMRPVMGPVPLQRLPVTAASQRMRPVQGPPQPVPPQRIPQPFPGQQVPIQMQRQPPLMVPNSGPQMQPIGPPRGVPLQQQQGPIKTQGPTPPKATNATGIGKVTDERVRSLSSDPDVKLTCLGIRAAGPAAIGLQISDFESLERSELDSCVEAIGLVDWGDDMRRELLLLYKQKLNLTSRKFTARNLLELGNLVTVFSTAGEASSVNGLFSSSVAVQGHDNFHPFDISSIDLSVPTNLESISVLGSRIKNMDLLKAIGEKLSQDNQLFKPQAGSTQTSFVRAAVLSMGNIICGLDEVVLKVIFDSSPSLFLQVSPMLGRLEGCEPETLSTLAHYAIQPRNYGDPKTWTPEDVDTLGVIVAGLTEESRASIPSLSMEAFHPLAKMALPMVELRRRAPEVPDPTSRNPDEDKEEIIAEPANEVNATERAARKVNGTISPTANVNVTAAKNTTVSHPTTNVTHHEGEELSEGDAESSAEKNLAKSMNFVFPVLLIVITVVYSR